MLEMQQQANIVQEKPAVEDKKDEAVLQPADDNVFEKAVDIPVEPLESPAVVQKPVVPVLTDEQKEAIQIREFFEDIMRLEGHLVHKTHVATFVKGLASAQAKADEVIAEEQPKFVPSDFTEGARFLALHDLNTMEKFEQIYSREDFKAIVFGLYDAYDTLINDEDATKLMKDIECEAKLACMRFKKNEAKKAVLDHERKLSIGKPLDTRTSVIKSGRGSVVSQDQQSPIPEANNEPQMSEIVEETVLIWKKNAQLMGSIKELEVPAAPGGDD